MTIDVRLGLAVASGVPALVLVSMGPVAALAGTPSVLVWGLSALMGFFMTLAFAELASASPHMTGGIGVLAARALRDRHPSLAVIAQWSYWFGWSPALAINGAAIGVYLHRVLLPSAPDWTAVAFAFVILAGSLTVNNYGIRQGARLQASLAAAIVTAVIVLAAAALIRGTFRFGNLTPFAPPDGWGSGHGIAAFCGALFVAGWSAYGAELALSYGTEYRRGVRDAVPALILVAIASVAAYTLVPLLLVGVLGVVAAQQDPATALAQLARASLGMGAGVVVIFLIVTLLLGLNMVMIGSSRGLYQMARCGNAWPPLGKLNRHGVPGNALRFDLCVNAVLLLTVLALEHGSIASVPITLLAAANVGYFLAIDLALLAAWLNHRAAARPAPLRLRRGLMRGIVLLAPANLALLALAGFAWGWRDVWAGAAGLAVAIAIFGRRRPRADARPLPRAEAVALPHDRAQRSTASSANFRPGGKENDQ